MAHIEWYERARKPVWSRYTNATARMYPFTEVFPELVYVAPTRARERGVEVEIERRAGAHVDWSASYVRSSATMQQVNGQWGPQAGDQPNAFRADIALHPLDERWRLTVSAMMHSGWPYTPQLVHVDTITQNNAQYVWITRVPGALYSERAAAYRRVDARWTRFIGTKSGRLSVFLDVYNIFNTVNERERYYLVSVNQLQTRLAQRSRLSLPRIPSVGFNWEF